MNGDLWFFMKLDGPIDNRRMVMVFKWHWQTRKQRATEICRTKTEVIKNCVVIRQNGFQPKRVTRTRLEAKFNESI